MILTHNVISMLVLLVNAPLNQMLSLLMKAASSQLGGIVCIVL